MERPPGLGRVTTSAGGADGTRTPVSRATVPLVCAVFFLSGFPALIYQLVWQRSLFAIYGINLESVTVVVTAFMLGLGLGSLAGGAVSRRRDLPLLAVFGAVELGIGAFGFVSLGLMAKVGAATLAWPAIATALVTFGLVVIPTFLMGATLPILTAYLVGRSGNVGKSVGLLYAVNTLGSAAACFAVAMFVARDLGEQGSVTLAAVINVTVGMAAIAAHVLVKGPRPATATRHAIGSGRDASPPAETAPVADRKWAPSLVLAAACGFIALSYEILWFRVYAFATQGAANTFAMLLGAFLLGIALGSVVVTRFCRGETAGTPVQMRLLGGFVLVANLLGFLLIPAVAWMAATRGQVGIGRSLVFVVVESGLLGATFPLLCHYAIKPDGRAGAGLSFVYLANILGSASGSLLTGYVLLDVWGIRGVSVFLAILGSAMAGGLLYAGRGGSGDGGARRAGLAEIVVPLSMAAVPLLAPTLFEPVYPKLLHRDKYAAIYGEPGDRSRRIARLVETKTGVVAVLAKKTVFGGGAYDGGYNVRLDEQSNINAIQRAYSLNLVHPVPRRVLVIGLSSGSWVQVIANLPQVEEVVVVEIGTAYLRLLDEYEDVRSIKTNPKVKIRIDDGRRWLNRNPSERFDVIVANTTFNWRAHTTNLLSVEFLDLVRAHLEPGGVYMFNPTHSDAAMYTAIRHFPHAIRVHNNVCVSDTPFDIDPERWGDALRATTIDGRPALDLADAEQRLVLETMLDQARRGFFSPPPTAEERAAIPFERGETLLERLDKNLVITDDNMGTEWLVPLRGMGG